MFKHEMHERSLGTRTVCQRPSAPVGKQLLLWSSCSNSLTRSPRGLHVLPPTWTPRHGASPAPCWALMIGQVMG